MASSNSRSGPMHGPKLQLLASPLAAIRPERRNLENKGIRTSSHHKNLFEFVFQLKMFNNTELKVVKACSSITSHKWKSVFKHEHLKKSIYEFGRENS